MDDGGGHSKEQSRARRALKNSGVHAVSMSTSVGMILIAQVTLTEAHGVAIFEEALASTASAIANVGAYDANVFIPWQVMIFIIVIVLTLTFMLGCVCGRLTGAKWQCPRKATPAAPTPDYDPNV
eukprot:3344111-Heterocapsa_arctica.AAC.1